MANAILLHGTGGNDQDYFWFADTRNHLIAKDCAVWWPKLPGVERPHLQETLLFLLDHSETLTEETILIGHSSACPLILALLERARICVKQTLLVAGFYKPIAGGDIPNLMLKEDYDFPSIKAHSKEIILINSDNDPWGCTAEAAMPVAAALAAPLIVHYGAGHMGSMSYNQPYRKFDLLNRLIKA